MKKDVLDHALKFIGSWLRFQYEHDDMPGYVVAIAYKGKVVFSEAYGYANVERKEKLMTDHIFQIASHSKTFTATALMQLQEQGKLKLDDPVVRYLPWLGRHKDKRWSKVTLRQLMSHGAGMIRDGLDADYWQLERPFPNDSELKKEVLEAELVLDNNIKLKYSNFGYSLLGMVIEAVSGQPYNQYVSEHIVRELGLKNTGPEYSQSINDTLVTGYSREEIHRKRLPIAQIDTHAMSAATGFYSTAEDLCTYFSAHFVGSKKLLDDESKKEMQRTQFHAYTPYDHGHSDYGLGLEIEYVGKRRLIGHGGGFPGHITESLADPKEELVVVALTNFLDSPATNIVKGIYGILDYFSSNAPDGKPKHDLKHLEGRYMHLWGACDIVVTGDKVVSTYPGTWYPLTQPEPLEYVNPTTLKVGETDSFMSEGELVHFKLKGNKVEKVNYNGTTMWPEAAWHKKLRDKKIIGS